MNSFMEQMGFMSILWGATVSVGMLGVTTIQAISSI